MILNFRQLIEKRDLYGRSAIMAACEAGQTQAVRILLHYGVASDVPDAKIDGDTPLLHSSCCADEDIALVLLENGSASNAVDDSGNTALMFAAEGKRLDLTRSLLRHSANANAAITQVLLSS